MTFAVGDSERFLYRAASGHPLTAGAVLLIELVHHTRGVRSIGLVVDDLLALRHPATGEPVFRELRWMDARGDRL